MAKKQFDLSHLKVDESLQGAHIASFYRRSAAFLIDWGIIYLCSQFLPTIILVVLVFLFVKKRFKSTLSQTSQLLNDSLSKLDNRLDEYGIEEKLRKRFAQHTKVYLYILMYSPILLALSAVGLIVYNLSTGKNIFSEGGTDFWGTPFGAVTSALDFIGAFLGAMAYFSFFTWKWQGQTPAKALLGIKVAKLNGAPLSLWNSFERFSGYSSSASLLFSGFFQYFWDKNHQTSHDKIAETIVIEVTKENLS